MEEEEVTKKAIKFDLQKVCLVFDFITNKRSKSINQRYDNQA